MTEDERTYAFALARVKFPPRCSCLKFIDSMIWLAQNGARRPLTPAQSKYLRSCVIRFQRQLGPGVVESARKDLERIKAAEQAGGGR
ncbi:hypothetical protein [Paracidovorax citrulli]|uniref:hypothetical protein n=1 Tax=Paracidovorax citrulli TaxID=80869 RepID=UPI0005FB0193|nr:hypothetical protein [Paracidovorax citrulli]